MEEIGIFDAKTRFSELVQTCQPNGTVHYDHEPW